ncbi:hypothetical protein FSP39_025258 [Pinctada imbricata]|uniref:D-serine dehydratase n=1 Tax=Pinctada imbricata TaxID=66713 RepID=A0AA89BIG2_PINIB|nr:hypothetical protein FSP39_025258 [Pinctada imbricata]
METEVLPETIYDVPTPAFLVDLERTKKNCSRMRERCWKLGVELRPHQKTHKTVEGGDLQTDGTRRKIVVSTLEEADFFSKNGFDDILYAYPITASKIQKCKEISAKCEQFHLMYDNLESLKALQNSPPGNGRAWSVFLEVDIGGDRTGIPWDDDRIISFAREAVNLSNIDFQGLYSHDGNSYSCTQGKNNKQGALEEWGQTASSRIVETQRRLKEHGIECRTFGVGSTPTCSVPDGSLSSLTEFHPGNYIFYDYMQYLIGSCEESDIACRVATRVVCHKEEQNRMYIDCGFLGVSHDGLYNGPEQSGMAKFIGHDELKFIGMTQELGFVSTNDGSKLDYQKYPLDSMLFFYPWHSCATAANHSVYYIHSGDKIVGKWRPTRGW